MYVKDSNLYLLLSYNRGVLAIELTYISENHFLNKLFNFYFAVDFLSYLLYLLQYNRFWVYVKDSNLYLLLSYNRGVLAIELTYISENHFLNKLFNFYFAVDFLSYLLYLLQYNRFWVYVKDSNLYLLLSIWRCSSH